jgi:hypothetical protein
MAVQVAALAVPLRLSAATAVQAVSVLVVAVEVAVSRVVAVATVETVSFLS